MLEKYWKKIAVVIVAIACLFNIVLKIVSKVPYLEQLRDSAQYAANQQEENSISNR